MTGPIKAATLAVLIIGGTIYALFAFAIWDANPGHWDIVARAFAAALFVGVLGPTLPIVGTMDRWQ